MKTEHIDLITLRVVYNSADKIEIAFGVAKNLLGAMTKAEQVKLDSLAKQLNRELMPILIRVLISTDGNNSKSSPHSRRKRSTN